VDRDPVVTKSGQSINPRCMMPPLYFFGWPSHVGGADTKMAHLLPLLAREAEIVLVPNAAERLASEEWMEWAKRHGIRTALRETLPERLEGWAVSLCNEDFFGKGIAFAMRRRGLKVAWSSEMMWHFRAELGAVMFGWVDVVLYTSAAQRAVLEPGYRHALSGGQEPMVSGPLADPEADGGELCSPTSGRRLRWATTGNYIDPGQFPFRERGVDRRPFTIGRLSRADPAKYPDDFPAGYEAIGLREPSRFRVMGWSEPVAAKWPDHRFDARWELLGAAAEPTVDFLHSLDVFVYDVSPRLHESWGRAVVEAMLTGAVPVVPRGGGHHLAHLVPDGVAGFQYGGAEEIGRQVRRLQDDPELLRQMSRGARAWAEGHLCRADDHLAKWRRVFTEA